MAPLEIEFLDERTMNSAPLAAAPQAMGKDIGHWAERWFELYPRPCLLVSRRLAVASLNVAAQTLIADDPGLVLRDGHFGARDRKVQATLEEAVRIAEVGEPIQRVLFSTGAIYVVRFVALGESLDAPVAVTLRATEQNDLVCADLAEPFGLTHAEQRIVERLLRGCSSQDIADAMGKSVLTVRTHIKRAYTKLSVATREQLFARLLPFLDT